MTATNTTSKMNVVNWTDETKEAVLTAMLDSIINKVPAVEATRIIASDFSIPVMSIAGMRSAYTKGQYGSPTYLIRKRRKQLRSAGQL